MDRDEAELKRKKFASTGANDSDRNSTEEQKKFCCTNIAMSVYTKAWEGAKKAIPSK